MSIHLRLNKFSKLNLFNPLTKIKNKEKYAQKSWFQLFKARLNKRLNQIFDDIYVDEEITKKILYEMALPQDIDINKLGTYSKKEFRKYQYIFSKKNKLAKQYPEPYYNWIYFSKLKSNSKRTESIIKFFKSISKN